MCDPRKRVSYKLGWLAGILAAGLLAATAAADEKKSRLPKSPPADNVKITPEAWKTGPKTPATPREIDQLLKTLLAKDNISPAPLTTDEQFIRRATLDLTGHLPVPADVDEFTADKDPQKRAKLIDRLLDSDEYARHWARYWRDVMLSKATAQQIFLRAPRTIGLEAWLFDQFKANKHWGEIAREIITATGTLSLQDPADSGAAGFLAAHFGPDAANERAADTARVFLGMQIQCAQCHDHPFDVWKRNQFHEMAAFYSRTRERRFGMGQQAGITITAANAGEHQMPSLEDPKKSTRVDPRFLLGGAIPQDQPDPARRKALADFVTSRDNYWFAAAYVNRIWGELMGQAFYQPVDDMGPQKDAFLPELLVRLALSFKAGNYDMKALFRQVMNSETYQHQIRLGESTGQHMHFAASYPTRLRADALWESLVNVLGTFKDPPRQQGGRQGQLGAAAMAFFRGLGTTEGQFKREFGFDPSTKPDEVEGSIPQALLLMNHPMVNDKIKAKDTNLLSRILKSYPDDKDALRILYLRTLARKPTDREMEKCNNYLAKVGNRAEAYEDLLWALINSTEFQTKR